MACTTFFNNYFNNKGYKEIIDGIQKSPGKTMIEKAINYANNTGKIKVITNGLEAQELANEGKDIGVIGYYIYNKAKGSTTTHYAIVAPSGATYDSEGNPNKYLVTGVDVKDEDTFDPNNHNWKGPLLANVNE